MNINRSFWSNKIFRHYGSKEFIPSLVDKTIVENDFRNKPMNGVLWASPVVDTDEAFPTTTPWKRWCENNDFRNYKEDNFFDFTLTYNSIVYVINSLSDYNNLPFKPLMPSVKMKAINFKLLINRYNIDAFYLTENGLHTTRFIKSFGDLIGTSTWDCESIVIVNKNIIELI